jgi:hypothetical protein
MWAGGTGRRHRGWGGRTSTVSDLLVAYPAHWDLFCIPKRYTVAMPTGFQTHPLSNLPPSTHLVTQATGTPRPNYHHKEFGFVIDWMCWIINASLKGICVQLGRGFMHTQHLSFQVFQYHKENTQKGNSITVFKAQFMTMGWGGGGEEEGCSGGQDWISRCHPTTH